MTTRFTLRNTFETDAATYWSKLFFDREYNRRLYLEGLGFEDFELLEVGGDPDGIRTRRIRVVPRSDAPAAVKKLLGGGLSYVEDGAFDSKRGIWTFRTKTSSLSDKISISGKIWVEPRGDKRIERFCEAEVEVRIFGLGSAVESYIEKTTRESYAKTELFTNRFIRDELGSAGS